MTADRAMETLQEMLTLSAIISAPVLLAGLVIGLVVAVFQAATQIQESSLNFVPKVLGVGLVVALMGSWALEKLTTFTVDIFRELATLSPGVAGWSSIF